jgi:hypothetical protein
LFYLETREERSTCGLSIMAFGCQKRQKHRIRDVHNLIDRDKSAQNMALWHVRFGFEERERRKDHSVS